MKVFRAAAAILAFVSLAAFWGCDNSPLTHAAVEAPPAPLARLVRLKSGEEVLDIDPARLARMTLEPVRRITLPTVLRANGQVTFDQRRVATIVSRVAGRIEAVRVAQWDNVRRGEPIVELYSPDFMTAEAEYLQAKRTASLSDTRALRTGGHLAVSMVEAAERKLELLGMEPADVRAISAPSPTVWMRAPIGGTVVQSNAVRGAAVAPGDMLYTLGTLTHVWITADIYEDDLARVQVGQQLEVITTAYPKEVFKGVISRISPVIDPATHTAQIRCVVNNPGLKLKPQMLARVSIMTRPGRALVVPQQALVFDTDAYYAFVRAGPGEIARRKVVIASWNERGYARVMSGLSPGETIVVAGSLQVSELWDQARGGG